MKNGLTSFSPASFANFGLAAVAVGNFEFGYRMGTLALKLSQRINASESASNVMVVVKYFIGKSKFTTNPYLAFIYKAQHSNNCWHLSLGIGAITVYFRVS